MSENRMTEAERQEVIAELLLITSWNEQVFEKMSNLELVRELDRQLRMNRS